MADARELVSSFWCARIADQARPPPDGQFAAADEAIDVRMLAEIVAAM